MSWDNLDPSEEQLSLLEDLGYDGHPDSMAHASELIDDLLRNQTSKERSERYKKKAMQSKPPSQKQLDYLASLGVHKVPGSMWTAARWIDEVLEAMG